MELHFCHVCGVSVPNATVDSGDARDDSGKVVCAEHRSAQSGSDDTAEGGDLELLFCANCRISVPVTDVRSGRARREYGSLHCAICTKADPGERAARREAVEAEMAADVEADDPVGPLRCTVCAAMVPHSHVVTGKALSEGDKVTCQNCRAAVVRVRASSGSGGGFARSAVMFLLVAGLAAGIGYGVGQMVDGMKSKTEDPLQGRVAMLEKSLDARFADMTARIPADTSGEQREATNRRLDRMTDDLELQLDAIRGELVGVRTELAKADVALEGRLSRLEGRLDEMSERVRDVASRPVPPPERADPPAGGGAEPPVEGGGMEAGGNGPVVPEVNAEVARLAKALLDSGEDSVRFPAANDLGWMGDPAAIPALSSALVNDKHFLVRRACARSLSQLRAWNATPYLIDALEDKEAYVAQQANFALREITTEDFDVTQDQSHAERRRKAKAARKWWEQNKDDPPEGVSLATADLIRDQ